MGTGRGLGKILFFGEHAAVQGFPALGASLPWKITLEHQRTEEGVWEFPGLPGEYRRPLEDALKTLEDQLGTRADRGILRLKSDLPVGTGFGSSGALCAALAQTFREGSFQEHWRLAHEMEKNFHGRPSGIDTGLALKEGMTAFFPQEKGLPKFETLRGLDLDLVIGALPREKAAKELIFLLHERYKAGDETAVGRLRTLGDLSTKAIDEVRSGTAQSKSWGEKVRMAQTCLRDLGLSTPELDQVLSRGEKEGALGGKLSGAGGGGAFFLVYGSSSSARGGKDDLLDWGKHQGIRWATPPEAFRWDSERSRLVLGKSSFDSLFKD